MFHIAVKPEQKEYAIYLTENGPEMHREWSGTKRQKMIGNLGETVWRDYYGYPRRKLGDADPGYDVMVDYKMGLRVDVKTAERSVIMKPSYCVNMTALQQNLICDFLFFMSINTAPEIWTASFCGSIEKKRFLQLATFHRKGEIWTKGNGKPATFEVDTFRLKASLLLPPKNIEGYRVL